MTTSTARTHGFTQAEWNEAHTWHEFLSRVEKKHDLWESAVRRAEVSDVAAARLQALPGKRRVLVLVEDWCGDAARSIPPLAKALEASPDVEVRYLDSDSHPDVLSRHLTHGGRAIPIVLVQDEHGEHLGTWGPRPAALQALVRARKLELGAPTSETMATWYAPIMGWYGKDRGSSTIDEVLMLLERGGAPR